MRIFLSYSYKDSHIADLIKERLIRDDHSIIQIERESRIGDNIAINIDQAIHNSDAYIVLLSKSYKDSKWSGLELMMIYDQTFGRKTHKRILPVLIDKSVNLPTLLKNVAYADFTDKNQLSNNVSRLVNDIKKIAGENDSYSYKRIKDVLKEQENLLKFEKNEYLLQGDKQQKIKNSFRVSFIIISVISGLISLLFLFNGFESKSILDSSITIQNFVFYLLGFLTAIIPSIYLVLKIKNKSNDQ